MPTRDVDAANQYQSYLKGWRAGACGREKDPRFAAHADVALNEAYERGYRDGGGAFVKDCREAARRYGYEPSILRVESSRAEGA